jgi:predicted PurR-regulated permease PerM
MMAAAQNSDGYQPQWSTWARQVVIVGSLIALVYALTLLVPVMRLLSITFLLCLVMIVPSRLVARYWHVPYGLAVTLCYALVILLMAAALVAFIPASVDEANNLRRDAEQRYNQLQDDLRRYTPGDGYVTVLGLKVDFDPFIGPVRNLALNGVPAAAGDVTPISTSDLRQMVTTAIEVLTAAISGIAISVSTSLTRELDEELPPRRAI